MSEIKKNCVPAGVTAGKRWLVLIAPCVVTALSLRGAAAQEIAAMNLPDAPRYVAAAGTSSSVSAEMPVEGGFGQTAAGQTGAVKPQAKVAGPFDKYIEPGETAPKLTVFDKTLLGLQNTINPISAGGWILAASYEQVTNGAPNYGQTAGGFGQRIGASAVRGVSEGVFSDAVLASALHQDPRYYRLGPKKNFLKRVVYAPTRVIFTRTDGGAETVNFSLLGGNLAGAALTQAYYPALNRGLGEVAKTFATSIAGSGFHFLVAEFFPNLGSTLHLSH